MTRLAGALISLSLFASAASQAQTSAAQDSQSINITRSGSQQSSKGAEYFTGSVEIEPLFPTHDPSRVIGGSVTFQPGARTRKLCSGAQN